MNIQGLLWFAVCFSPGKFKSKDRQFHLRPPGLARKTMTSSAEQKFVLVMKFLGRCHWNNNVRCIYMFCCLALWFGSTVANHVLCIQGLLWFAVCFSPGKFKSKDRQFHLRPPGLARRTMTSSAIETIMKHMYNVQFLKTFFYNQSDYHNLTYVKVFSQMIYASVIWPFCWNADMPCQISVCRSKWWLRGGGSLSGWWATFPGVMPFFIQVRSLQGWWFISSKFVSSKLIKNQQRV